MLQFWCKKKKFRIFDSLVNSLYSNDLSLVRYVHVCVCVLLYIRKITNRLRCYYIILFLQFSWVVQTKTPRSSHYSQRYGYMKLLTYLSHKPLKITVLKYTYAGVLYTLGITTWHCPICRGSVCSLRYNSRSIVLNVTGNT